MASNAASEEGLGAKWMTLSQDKKGNTVEMKKFMEEHPSFDIDYPDSTGMTALQHASFRGNAELCEYLLEKGADVNSDKHENQYTTLMFGALSGNEEIVNLLLDAGAKPDAKNSVNRTAGEMASFVAQYHIGGVITNFYPSKGLERFTKPTGLETRPKLKKELLKPFHALISSYNIHPIYLVRELYKTPGLLDDSKYLQDILNILVIEKMRPHDTHESQAFKFHYISCIIGETAKQRAAAKADDNGKAFIKKLAKGRASDGFLDQVEQLVRSTLRSYPKAESKLFQMLLMSLAKVEIGSEPTGIIAVTDAINGKRMRTAEDQVCDICGCREPKHCKKCKKAAYCSAECQKIHWPTHKKFCKEPEPIQEL